MKKIDSETVSRIIDAADIVEVVSDFVTLKKRGANYIGLCPFHSERTPSFSVSKSRGICKCFSCGKGGSPVNFLMELEQMSYQEALRWLAKKYNIPIKEREETEVEKLTATERESLYAVNNFALGHFESNLFDTEEGRDIGLAYFHERGLTTETIKKFRLGYALEKSDALYKDAIKKGYSEENLVKSGLCSVSERGVYDRFRGRVIYPVFAVSGKIVAFGGRTLRSDKNIAKYVNSPESSIYSKSRELYGLFQARRAIVKEDKCILVEGYMDVLSMAQSGVENVVASSGTSLTSQQVNLIHRFTNNVTVIYDADPAGIKASLRGIDMLLSEGMNVKIVLFPEGEDPDSYARSHTAQELHDYLKENETDFIKFKIAILLKDVADDPIKRSHAISDILRSIAVIPDSITRQVYIDEAARTFGIEAKVLALEVAKGVAKKNEEAFNASTKDSTEVSKDDEPDNLSNLEQGPTETQATRGSRLHKKNPLEKYERAILRYPVRYGLTIITEVFNDDGSSTDLSLLDYIAYELDVDMLTFSDPLSLKLFERLKEMSLDWEEKYEELKGARQQKYDELKALGLERIRKSAASISEIMQAEKDLETNIQYELDDMEKVARSTFFHKGLLSDPDEDIRLMATDFLSDKYQLSKVHSKFAKVVSEEERLAELVPRAIYELKDAVLRINIDSLNAAIKDASDDKEKVAELLHELMEKIQLRSHFASYLGDRIIMPRIK